MNTETACPAHKTCPGPAETRAARCFDGYYVNSNTCTKCAAGKYCWPAAAATDTGERGSCTAGYACQSGSAYQKPVRDVSSISAGSSEASSYNGPALKGHTADGTVNTKCALGKF